MSEVIMMVGKSGRVVLTVDGSVDHNNLLDRGFVNVEIKEKPSKDNTEDLINCISCGCRFNGVF